MDELLRRPIQLNSGLLFGLKSGTTDTAQAVEVVGGAMNIVSNAAFPQAWFLNWSIVSTLGTALALPADLTNYAIGFVTFSGLGAETVLMQALVDGTVVSDAIMVQKTDGTFAAATALANGTYRFPMCFKSAQITKSAAVATMTATFAFKAGT